MSHTPKMETTPAASPGAALFWSRPLEDKIMRRSGFTLIELLIVVAIIGILAAIAVPNFMNAQVRAKVARAQSEMRSIQSALEAFYIDNSGYPPADCSNRLQMRRQYRGVDEDPGDWVVDFVHVMVGSGSTARRFYLTTPVAYISSLPADPFRGDGNEEGYGYGSNGQSYYILSSWGPDQQDGNEVEELFECHYTGARISDSNKVAFRESEQWLLQHEYNPSNGVTSDGDIIRVGP